MTSEMLTNILTILDTLAVIILPIGLVYLIINRERRRDRHLSEEDMKIVEAEAKASAIIHHGVEMAQKMIVRAELEGIALLSRLKLESRKIESDQQQQIKLILEEMRKRTEIQSEDASRAYEAYLKNLQNRLEEDLLAKQKLMEEKVNQMFAHTQALLNNFVDNLQKQTEIQVDKEIGRARAIINEYRQKRLEIVDENIVGILERTMNITLGKKLSLSDQTQLVYEALEEAKKENIFV